jgi:hypothetical protein
MLIELPHLDWKPKHSVKVIQDIHNFEELASGQRIPQEAHDGQTHTGHCREGRIKEELQPIPDVQTDPLLLSRWPLSGWSYCRLESICAFSSCHIGVFALFGDATRPSFLIGDTFALKCESISRFVDFAKAK